MDVYRWTGWHSTYTAEAGAVVRVWSPCGGSIAVDTDGAAAAAWWAAYHARRPESRGDEPGSVVVTRPDGTTFPLAPHLPRLAPAEAA